mmetsp:Transcript_2416/g.5568  ORF Transcript_2416/g.5568 Transcript_2416/m.5568 type:complete len:178 (-) Transcript_2416:109-642(-)
MSSGESQHVDADGHVEDGIPRMRERLLPTEAAKPQAADTSGEPQEEEGPDDGEVELEELDSIDDPDGVLGDLMKRLQSVMGALSDTERENQILQDEIKELLSDQDEQHELRDELGDQLRERSDLMAQLAHQALSDTEQNSAILQRIAKLSEDAAKERELFSGEMARLDAQLSSLGAQ